MTEQKVALGIWEKYIYVWILLCMVIGVLLGRFLSGFLPVFELLLETWTVYGLSIPIGIALFLVMYPTVAEIEIKEIRKAAKKPKPLLLTLIGNWLIAPIIMTLLANFFLAGYPEFIAGAILLGIAPCTALVLFWIKMARADLGQGIVNTAINSLTLLGLYGFSAGAFLGVSGIPVPWKLIALGVILYIAVPIGLGIILRIELTKRRGKVWYDNKYLPIMRRLAIVGLVFDLILIFAYGGEPIINNPAVVGLISIPLLIQYGIMVTLLYGLGWLFNWDYETSACSALIGSSSHFEVAIAVAITVWGVRSGAALATVIGPLWEVPLMITASKLFLRSKHFFPRRPRVGG